MRKVPFRPKESDIQRTILDYLTILEKQGKPIFFWKQNNVGTRKPDGGWIPAPMLGVADIICCVRGRFLAIEVKVPGGHQSQSQGAFEADVRRAGGEYVLAKSIEDVEGILRTL
jgi:hypothetical protein